jgi:hypothetical protein
MAGLKALRESCAIEGCSEIGVPPAVVFQIVTATFVGFDAFCGETNPLIRSALDCSSKADSPFAVDDSLPGDVGVVR